MNADQILIDSENLHGSVQVFTLPHRSVCEFI